MNASPPLTPHSLAGCELPVAQAFGRFRLLQLLGKSRRSMAWRVTDARQSEVDTFAQYFLFLPRERPADAQAREQWHQGLRRAARLEHPQLAMPIEAAECEHWPYALYEATGFQTLSERLQSQPMGGHEAATVLAAVLQGLAFAHEGGAAHRDLQPYMVALGERGHVRVIGLEVGSPAPSVAAITAAAPRTSIEALALTAQREAARYDVLCAGALLHLALCGRPALDEPDVGLLVQRMPPLGREVVRLPWDMPLPVSDAMRAIANRATDRHARQRYQGARAMLRALEGWLHADSSAGGGPLALLIDRLHGVGVLPASPGNAARAARLATMDQHRVNELAQVVLHDLAHALELLRAVNSAQVRGAYLGGAGPVLTVRRAIAILGVDAVRRSAQGLRDWPGPMSNEAADELRALFDGTRRAARVAQALRPAGYDAEVVHLVCVLQNLGRLITAYHFPEEWQQIRRLMLPTAATRPGEPDDPGMSEQEASYAVLGTDIETIGVSVARHCGFDDSVLHMARRLPLSTTPRTVDNDDAMLRAVASCAIEAIEAVALTAPQRAKGLQRVARRYARCLSITMRDIQDALNPVPKQLDAVAAQQRSIGAARPQADRSEATG